MEKQFRFVYFIHKFVKNRITKKNCYSEKKKRFAQNSNNNVNINGIKRFVEE